VPTQTDTDPASTPISAALERAWKSRTRPAAGGHLDWIPSDHRFYWKGRRYEAGHIAFMIRTRGRAPVGHVRTECDHPGCIEPQHVDDAAARNRTRAQYRAVQGLAPRPPLCIRGHDQDTHGRYTSDGVGYCYTCSSGADRRPKADAALARQQLQELTAAGFPLRFIAGHTLIGYRVLVPIRSGDTPEVYPGIAERIAAAYDHLATTRPRAHGIPERAIGHATAIADRNQWTRPQHPPHAA
jgi:hypothetical protein